MIRYANRLPGAAHLAGLVVLGGCLGEGTAPLPIGEPVALMVTSGNDQLFFPNSQLPVLLAVRLVDRNGEPVTLGGVRVAWEVIEGAGSVERDGDTTTSQGFATARWTLGSDVGANRMLVTARDFPTLQFSARAAMPGPIVFVSNRISGIEGNEVEGFPGDLFVMNADGSDVIAIPTPSGAIQTLFDPIWAPDGRRIAFVRATGRPAGGVPGLDPVGIFVVEPIGTVEQRVPVSGFPPYVEFFQDPAWNPSGSKLVAYLAAEGQPNIPPDVSPGQLHIMNSDGTSVNPLETPVSRATAPSWTPAGSAIAFACTLQDSIRICRVDDNGRGFQQLTDGPADIDPAWSPDGTRLLFARDSVNAGGIWVVDVDGTNQAQLVQGKATSPSWAPDGSQFVYTLDDGGRVDIYLFELLDSVSTNLTNAGSRDREASWRR